jgi:hypothetical protein
MWIAARVPIGTAKGAKSVLPHLAQSQDQRKTASALEPCAQLEFQSTVDPFPVGKPSLPGAGLWLSWVHDCDSRTCFGGDKGFAAG